MLGFAGLVIALTAAFVAAVPLRSDSVWRKHVDHVQLDGLDNIPPNQARDKQRALDRTA